MATRLYGISRGESDLAGDAVTEGVGSATSADDLEVTIDLAAGFSREEAVRKLDAIKAHWLKGNWPPA